MIKAYLLLVKGYPRDRYLVTNPPEELSRLVASLGYVKWDQVNLDSGPALLIYSKNTYDVKIRSGATEVSYEDYKKIISKDKRPDSEIVVAGYIFEELCPLFERYHDVARRLQARSRTSVQDYFRSLTRSARAVEIPKLLKILDCCKSTLYRWSRENVGTDGKGYYSGQNPSTPNAIRILYHLDNSDRRTLLLGYLNEIKYMEKHKK